MVPDCDDAPPSGFAASTVGLSRFSAAVADGAHESTRDATSATSTSPVFHQFFAVVASDATSPCGGSLSAQSSNLKLQASACRNCAPKERNSLLNADR
jgi:hypothetical protein